MRKTVFVLLFVFVAGMVSAASADEGDAVAISMPSQGYDDDFQCEFGADFVDSVLDQVLSEMGLDDYAYRNVTNARCYSNNIYLNVDLKRSESDYKVRRLGFSVYSSTDYDYSVLFSSLEDEKLGWTLKRKYVDYFENGTDGEYYVSISANWDDKYDCNGLRQYYDGLTGEKYYDESNDYCSAVVRTKTSEVKSLVSESVGYINYLSDALRFSFQGYSEGVFDLESLSSSLGCSVNKGDYYYPEIDFECYGIYKDKTRVYFSAYTNIGEGHAYVNAYGYEGGDAVLSASAYGKGVTEDALLGFVREVTGKYLGEQYSLTINADAREVFLEDDYKSLSGKARISGFSVDVSGLDVEEYQNNKYYSGENVSVSVSEPYIQVYVPEKLEEAQVVSSEKSLMPYYWGRNFIITGGKVFSSVNLEENNPVLAEEKIKEFVSPYLETGSWVLDMSVTGGWYYPVPLGVRSAGVAEDTVTILDAGESASNHVSSQGVSDSFTSEFPEFKELDEKKPSFLESIINFVKSLFGG